MIAPFFTIIMRTFREPRLVIDSLLSLLGQEAMDFELLLIRDSVGRGIKWANTVVAEYRNTPKGKYVLVLDDDDAFVSPTMLKDLRAYIESSNCPGIVIVRAQWNGSLFPEKDFWGKRPVRKHISTQNLCVACEVFNQHAQYWNIEERAGDWTFINDVFTKSKRRVVWYDRICFSGVQHYGKRDVA